MRHIITGLILSIGLFFFGFGPAEAQKSQPNILLIVVDDMGYSDVGAFGGEIRTPNINALARSGLRLTSFYVSPTCSPTRSMLLSGTDNHLAGLGTMGELIAKNQKGKPGYEGHLNNRVVTFASLLRDAGYHTYMAGKWHLGDKVEHDPSNRGFERSFTMLQGSASHFGDEWMAFAGYTPIYRENGKRVHLRYDFYSSKSYTDKIIEYIGGAKDAKPFFAYLALTAPHDPLHVPDAWLHKYKGRYDAGYAALRKQRLARMKKLGIVPKGARLSKRFRALPKWASFNSKQKRRNARRMELYAAMIENLDYHLGRLFNYLKKTGKYDNTLIIFFSDNGASPAEFTAYPGTTKAWLERNSDNRFENWGRRGSRIDMGAAWATASNTPLRYFKGLQAEGGIRVPFIAAGPGVARRGTINTAFTHVMDIAPTLLEIAGVSHPGPGTYKGRKVLPMLGKSMAQFLKGKARVVRSVRDAVGWELFRGRALRQGRWKAIWLDKPFGGGQWQLFDLATDISERNNLAKTKKGRLLLPILVGKWDRYSKSVGVVMPPGPVKLK